MATCLLLFFAILSCAWLSFALLLALMSLVLPIICGLSDRVILLPLEIFLNLYRSLGFTCLNNYFSLPLFVGSLGVSNEAFIQRSSINRPWAITMSVRRAVRRSEDSVWDMCLTALWSSASILCLSPSIFSIRVEKLCIRVSIASSASWASPEDAWEHISSASSLVINGFET